MMPIKFAGKLNAFSRGPRGFFVKLEIGADDDWEDLAKSPLGMTFGVVMVPIDPETGVRTDASPGADSPPRSPDAGLAKGESGKPLSEKPRKHWSEMSRAQQAGILCREFGFGKWLMDRTSFDSEEVARSLRQRLGISSRADIDDNPEAARAFDAIVSRYRTETGQQAEQR